jgi:hypothetical protein
MLINTIVDYIPLSVYEICMHFIFLLFPFYKNYRFEQKYNLVYGYSCRSLYQGILETFRNKNIKILTTPIHHTSFINITEKYTNNIHIIEVRNNVIVNSEVDSDIDICLVSHMFGLDMDVDYLNNIKRNNPNCIFIEDRVQGGSFDLKFSHNIFDISLYSMGMDKKPCGLGGGIAFLKPHRRLELFYKNFLSVIGNYESETRLQRAVFLLKKIPSFFLYNNRIIINLCLRIFRYLDIDLLAFIKYYRKTNPGFEHDNYSYKPSNSLISSINYSLLNYKKIEKLYITKSSKYLELLNKENLIDKYYPYLLINDTNTNLNTIETIFYNINLSTYNSLYIKERKNELIDLLNKKYIPVIENPTYKYFNHEYKNKQNDKIVVESIVYIPSLMNMTTQEIKYLVTILKNFNN